MSKMKVTIEVTLSDISDKYPNRQELQNQSKSFLESDLFQEIRSFFLANYYAKEVTIKQLLITSNSGNTYYENHEAGTTPREEL